MRPPRLAALLLPVLMLALTAVVPAGAGGQPGGAAQLKAAALARVTAFAPDVPVVRVQIVRVVGEWATVRVSPPAGVTDPATVILRREDGVWVGVAGPGTAFPPGSRAGAPDDLLDDENPYTGDLAQATIDRLGGTPRTYAAGGISFRYPAAATVQRLDSGVLITGPAAGTGIFPGPAYEITIAVSAHPPAAPLDEYGYDLGLSESDGPSGPGSLLRSFTTYPLDEHSVAQIDRFGGDSTLRTFLVAPPEGAPLVRIDTRVYPVENNPAAPQAESAVALLLQTIQIETMNAKR